MASAQRQLGKVRQTICESLIPEVGEFGDVWLAKAERSLWLATRSGVVVNLSELLLNLTPVAPPRNGRDGIDGAPGAKGERGERGADGKDGRNGTDAVGHPGRHGLDGAHGKDGAPGADTAAVLAETRTALANVRTEFAALQNDFETLRLACVTSSKKNAEYLAWLQERVANRLKGKQ